jgi:tetratricopeptide (TPR) repeat protein
MPNLSAKLQQAVSYHQSGRLGRAEALYEEILRDQPRNAVALHMLGLCAAQNKNLERSVALIGKALELDPNNAIAYNNRGSALQELEQWPAALANFNRAITLQPGYAKAHYNCGRVLRELEQLDGALGSFERAVAIKADYAEAHSGRGLVFYELGRLAESLTSYDRAVAADPNLAEAWFSRGVLLKRLGQKDEALASYDRAIAVQDEYAEAHFNRGNLLHELGRRDAALASFERAIAIRPHYAQAHCNRAVILQEVNQLAEALASLDRAIDIEPAYTEAHLNRGVVLHELQRLDAALASYDKAIAIDPEFPEAHFYRSLTLLLAGDFERGWVDHEWRSRCKGASKVQEASQAPQWHSRKTESLAGKTVLLRAEQGLGDTIQFCRYATAVAELGATVILEVQRPLMSLLAGLEGASRVIGQGDALPGFDHQCTLMSLPLAFGTTVSSVPAAVPYLRSSAEKLDFWKEKLGDRRKARVGLVWSGGFRAGRPELWPVNDRRNIPLAKLAPLRHADIEFISLQKGRPAESELAELTYVGWDGPALTDFSPLLNDFSDTAALIEQLDLVISVDTSTAHLAGALGKPVWILNRFDSCWRWLTQRTDSPWYPTARLYRQERASDWDGVVERVRADLMRMMT